MGCVVEFWGSWLAKREEIWKEFGFAQHAQQHSIKHMPPVTFLDGNLPYLLIGTYFGSKRMTRAYEYCSHQHSIS